MRDKFLLSVQGAQPFSAFCVTGLIEYKCLYIMPVTVTFFLHGCITSVTEKTSSLNKGALLLQCQPDIKKQFT